VVLVIIAGVVWWQWDRIAGFFGSSGGTVAEVTNFRCEAQSGGRVAISGSVRNVSPAPLGFTAVTVIQDTSGRVFESREANVRPNPVPPSQGGYFQTDGPPVPEGGACKFSGLLDADTGRQVEYRRR
jgi:hypothetical protein